MRRRNLCSIHIWISIYRVFRSRATMTRCRSQIIAPRKQRISQISAPMRLSGYVDDLNYHTGSHSFLVAQQHLEVTRTGLCILLWQDCHDKNNVRQSNYVKCLSALVVYGYVLSLFKEGLGPVVSKLSRQFLFLCVYHEVEFWCSHCMTVGSVGNGPSNIKRLLHVKHGISGETLMTF